MFDLASIKDGKFYTQRILDELKSDKKLWKRLVALKESKAYSTVRALYHLTHPEARTTSL